MAFILTKNILDQHHPFFVIVVFINLAWHKMYKKFKFMIGLPIIVNKFLDY